jgi:hypothetical protein
MDREADVHGMAVLLENQARQLIDENTTTNPSGVSTAGEQWNGVALPLVRKVFGEIAAKEFVSVQPMNLPSGLIFFMDFQYGSAHKLDRTVGDSVFGISAQNFQQTPGLAHGFPTASTVPQGGLYGDGKFGYSINDQTADTGVTLSSQSLADAAGLQIIKFNETVSASVSPAATDSPALYTASLSGMTRPDLLGVRAFVPLVGSASGTVATGWLPEFTFTDGTNLYFVADGAQTPVAVLYHQQPVDSARGDFEDQRSEIIGPAVSDVSASLGIPEIDLELRSIPIVAKTRKLKAVWTPELAQDLNAYHSIDAEAELTAMLSEYISLEIDLEILDMLIINAQTREFWSTRIGQVYNAVSGLFVQDPNLAGQAWTNQTWFETLGQKIQKVSNKIHQLTLRGGANFVVCSPDVATILETIPGFTVETDGDKMKFAAGVTQIGSFQNRYTVYKNPYMLTNCILLGYKGANFLETGAVYAPYVPLVMTPLVYDPDNFTPRRGVLTRYAKKIVRPEFYGLVVVEGLSRV